MLTKQRLIRRVDLQAAARLVSQVRSAIHSLPPQLDFVRVPGRSRLLWLAVESSLRAGLTLPNSWYGRRLGRDTRALSPSDHTRVPPVRRAATHRHRACAGAALKSRRQHSQRYKETFPEQPPIVEASNPDLHTRQSRALFSPGFQSPWRLLVLLHRVQAYCVPTTRLAHRTTVGNAHT